MPQDLIVTFTQMVFVQKAVQSIIRHLFFNSSGYLLGTLFVKDCCNEQENELVVMTTKVRLKGNGLKLQG